jgi:phosphatidylinositol glycan class B
MRYPKPNSLVYSPMNLTLFHRYILLIAGLLYIVTAWSSHGYYHPDEHYQIIEFANFKLGEITAADLPWEYGAQIRPTLQPAMAYVLFKSLYFIGVSDPYHLAFALRLLTVLLALFSIRFFIKSTLASIHDPYKKVYIVVSYFLSGLCFLLALGLAIREDKMNLRTAVSMGILLGLSFLFRFQSLLLSVGLLAWMTFIRKESIYQLGIILVAGLLVLQLGILVDMWFYDAYLYTFINYFKVNLVDDVASTFGTSPWYTYISYILVFPTMPIGILILSALLIWMIRQPKSAIVWSVLPFLVVHSLIPHKEERFLFPLLNMVPFIILWAWQTVVPPAFLKVRIVTYAVYIGATLFIAVNTLGLVAGLSKTAGLGRMAISKHIHDNYGAGPVKILSMPHCNPYRPWPSLPARFYDEVNITVVENNGSVHGFFPKPFVKSDTTVLAIAPRYYSGTYLNQRMNARGVHFKLIKESVPSWIQDLMAPYGGFEMDAVIKLYEIGDEPI